MNEQTGKQTKSHYIVMNRTSEHVMNSTHSLNSRINIYILFGEKEKARL